MYNETILNFKGYIVDNGINIRPRDGSGPYSVIAYIKTDDKKYVAARGKNGIRFFTIDLEIEDDVYQAVTTQPVYDLEWENCKVMFETLKSEIKAGITNRQLDYDMEVATLYLIGDNVH